MDKNIKYVVAKSVGPNICLTIGKSYEVRHITYKKKNTSGNYHWVTEDFKYNSDSSDFYIEISEDDNGIPRSIWNDYFYSTKEMREMVIDGILE